jgi:hypothetical protein
MLAERPVLTRDAVEASRSHRVVAERLLRDYAQLAADEMVRRSSAEVGYSGYYPLVVARQEAVAAGDPPDRAILAREERQRSAPTPPPIE